MSNSNIGFISVSAIALAFCVLVGTATASMASTESKASGVSVASMDFSASIQNHNNQVKLLGSLVK